MSRHHYVILHIRSGMELVSTRFESKAATALDPGTVYGFGGTIDEARVQAEQRRKEQLDAGY